nr:precorrin-6A reductase [Lachnospira hominis]
MVTPRGYNNKSEKSIIIFAGTTEGRHLADYASGLNIDTHIFVATEYGEMILKDDKSFDGNKCIIHTGRLDEAEIKEEIEKINPMAVFDATHPFAVQVTENIKNACEKTTTKYIRIKRDKENYNLVNREKVRSAGSAEEAAIILSAPCYKNKKVLLTTGSKTVGVYSHLEGFKDNYYLRMLPNVQMLGEVLKSGIKNSNVICMQGPFSENMNYEMIKNYGIEVLVTKNSGNTGGTQEKINAAMRAGTEVIIIEDTGSDECIGIGLSEALKYITEIVEK